MRSTLLVILSVLVLVAGFLLYQKVVTKPAAAGSERSAGSEMAPKQDMAIGFSRLHLGEAWYSSYSDDKDNKPKNTAKPAVVSPSAVNAPTVVDAAHRPDEVSRLKSQFRAARYDPQPNGKIKVRDPEAWFYMQNGQKMRLIGTDGEVVVPEQSGGGAAGPDSPAAPSRGRIHTVTIELFNMYPDSRPNVPDETMTTDNINFDNETMLITTEAFKEGGTLIPADQVPVHMRSKSTTRGYDLDGRGMQLRWNDKDGRLDLLEIAHGDWLMVKDTSSSSSVIGGPGSTQSHRNRSHGHGRRGRGGARRAAMTPRRRPSPRRRPLRLRRSNEARRPRPCPLQPRRLPPPAPGKDEPAHSRPLCGHVLRQRAHHAGTGRAHHRRSDGRRFRQQATAANAHDEAGDRYRRKSPSLRRAIRSR